MALKEIVISSEDGRVSFTTASSLAVDDVTHNFTSNIVSASNVTLTGISTVQKILTASNGTFGTFANGSYPSGALAYDGNKWVTSSILTSDYTGDAVGDISGNYFYDVKVTNIGNVSAGTLPIQYGGTGASITPYKGTILESSRSLGGAPVISGLSAYASGSIISSYENKFEITTPAWKPIVQVYTTPGTYTWRKPIRTNFARVIVQGAGGSGGNGARTTTTWTPGGAGGGGGFTESTYLTTAILSGTVVVGAGGAQPSGTVAAGTVIAGNAGGASSFTATGISLTANGGSAGPVGSTTVAAAAGGTATGGTVTKTGGSSNAHNLISSIYDAPGGGGIGRDYLGATTLANAASPATVNKLLNISGLFGYDYNLLSSTTPSLAVTGGAGANPTTVQSNFYDDPYLLLHMKPFYEKKVDTQTSLSYNPTLAYNGLAWWRTDIAPFAGANTLDPWFYSSTGNAVSGYYGGVQLTPNYSVGSLNFTWEFWLYRKSATASVIIDARNNVASTNYSIELSGSGQLRFYAASAYQLNSNLTVPLNTWTHVAFVRSGVSTARFYINGQQDSATGVANGTYSDTTKLNICNPANLSSTLDGYLSEIRLSNNARYSSTFVPPTQSLTNDANTVLLMNGPVYDNAITNQTVDSSYYGRQVTFNGAANLTQSLTAFGDTAYVLSPLSLTNKTGSITVTPGEIIGTRDFTAETFIYLNSSGSNKDTFAANAMRGYIIDTRVGSVNTSARYGFTLHDNAKLGLYIGGSAAMTATSSQSVPLGQWAHIALVRQNSTASFYINGSKDIVSASWTSFLNDAANGINIGSHAMGTPNLPIDGYIDEFRITPKALYTQSFAPPTSRFSDPYNPLLLLHMEPSGSINATADSSKSKNTVVFRGVLSAVTSASIDTSVGNPFSTTGNSLLLSGSATSSPAITTFGQALTRTEPFTFECWVYRKANNAEPCIYDSRIGANDATGWYLGVHTTTNQLRLYSNAGYQYNSNLVIPYNTWTHIAFVRNGTNTNTSVYINGVRDTKNLTLNSTYNFTNTRSIFGAAFNAQNQTLYGNLDEVRISKSILYTGSVLTVPSAPFPDPTGYSYTFPATGSSGIFGSGGGGGGNTLGILQELNEGYLGGKGGDGYVAIISW